MSNKINKIFIHHSASNWGNALVIDEWHKDRGWKGIGYHFVIQNGIPTYDDYKNNRKFNTLVGEIECGRHLDADPWLEANEIGAHAYGYNRDSVGICLIHKEGKYDKKMLKKLFNLVIELIDKYDIPIENVWGHYEADDNKPDCPSINMNKFRKRLYTFFKSTKEVNMLPIINLNK